VLATNPRSTKNKAFGGARILAWFREREQSGTIKITESATTWRCIQEIASFSDGIFDDSWGLKDTSSMNDVETGHDGVFLIRPEHANEYVKRFKPQCLRHSVSCGKEYDFDYINFKLSKGLTRERILIMPTDGIREFIKKGKYLDPGPASALT
jgi:DNA helicase II / ATP-dependent DNA helicase PcrA